MILQSIRATALLVFLTAVLYPAVVTGVGQLAFSEQANGSMLRRDDGTVLGSSLIGQSFASPGYLQGRPSAAGAGYDGAASSGSTSATPGAAAASTASSCANNPSACVALRPSSRTGSSG